MFDQTFIENVSAVRHYRCMTTNESLHQGLRLLRARRERLTQEIGALTEQLPNHIRYHDLERYYLGLITDETELPSIEEHLLWCHDCIDRAEETAAYVDGMRRAIITGNFDPK
jgi:hypothetical protein